MSRTRTCLSVLAAAAMTASFTFAQPAKDTKPAGTPASKEVQPAKPASKDAQPGKTGDKPALPPGMSEADLQAVMAAATPGPMHEYLAKHAGTWSGKCTDYCSGDKPTTSECTTVITSFMDGRFTRSETKGEMGEMPFQGFGINGYDNVSKKFQMTWVDSMGTGMMVSTGELSADSKTLNWTGTYNCPIKKGPITCRIIEKETGPDSMTMEMFGPDPTAGGKEKKMMEIAYTRTAKATPAAAPVAPKPSNR